MNKATSALEYFTNNEWKWSTENVTKLQTKMSDEDLEHFNFKIELLNWSDFLKDYLLGTRQYILKDPLGTMTEARRKLWFFKVLHVVVQIGILYLFYHFMSLAFWT